MYRGDSRIEAQAHVRKAGETVGVVAEVLGAPPEQRVVVMLAAPGALTAGDRYLPFRYENRTGFKVVAGEGEPLADGAVVEAGFAVAREPAAGAPSQAPGGATAPAAAQETPEARRASAKRAAEWAGGSMVNDLRRAGLDTTRFGAGRRELAGRLERMAVEARRLAPEEAVPFLDRESQALFGEIEDASSAARAGRDYEGVRELNELRVKSRKLYLALRREAEKGR